MTRLTTSTLALLALTASSCGGGGNSQPSNLTPVNQAPTAVIMTKSTDVDERQSFELTAENSTDPEGDALAYQWTQTAGSNVTIDDAASVSITMTMPETDQDETLQFTLEVSDGALSNSTTINVVNKNIVMSPESQEFQEKQYDSLAQVRNPRETFVHYDVGLTDPGCGSGLSSYLMMNFIGDDDLDNPVNFQWEITGPSLNFDELLQYNYPRKTDIPADLSDEGPKITAVGFSYEQSCSWEFPGFIDPPNPMISAISVLPLFVDQDEGKLMSFAGDVVETPSDICGVDYIVGTDAVITASKNGGLTLNKMELLDRSEIRLESSLSIAEGGEYCEFIWINDYFVRDSSNPWRSNIIAHDASNRSLVSFENDSSDNDVFSEIHRVSYDQDSSEGLNVVSVDFTKDRLGYYDRDVSNFAAITLTDGLHDGDSRILLFEYFYDIASDGEFPTFNYLRAIDLPKGVPEKVYISSTHLFVVSSTSPYIAVYDCDELNRNACGVGDPEFIEVGFDVHDLWSKPFKIYRNSSLVGMYQRLVVTRKDAGGIQVYESP